MVENTTQKEFLLNYAREMLLDIVADIAISDDDRVKQAYLGSETIEELKVLPAEPEQTPDILGQLRRLTPYNNP